MRDLVDSVGASHCSFEACVWGLLGLSLVARSLSRILCAMARKTARAKASKKRTDSFQTYIARVLKQVRRGRQLVEVCAVAGRQEEAGEVHPKVSITKKSMSIMNTLVTDTFEKVDGAAYLPTLAALAHVSFEMAQDLAKEARERPVRAAECRANGWLVCVREVASEAGRLCKLNKKQTLTSREVHGERARRRTGGSRRVWSTVVGAAGLCAGLQGVSREWRFSTLSDHGLTAVSTGITSRCGLVV